MIKKIGTMLRGSLNITNFYGGSEKAKNSDLITVAKSVNTVCEKVDEIIEVINNNNKVKEEEMIINNNETKDSILDIFNAYKKGILSEEDERLLKYTKSLLCKVCNGTGTNGDNRCHSCDGIGLLFNVKKNIKCPSCSGRGNSSYSGSKCYSCDGTGRKTIKTFR